jgi:DNA modification methylase
MKPYYQDDSITVYNGDFRDFLGVLPESGILVTDPPYNIGFSAYDVHQDNMSDDDYIKMMAYLTHFRRAVIIDYPEETARYIVPSNGPARHYSSWSYNANTPRRFRLVSWYGCTPDYSRVKVPYKNMGDKRVQELIKNGSEGTNLYEWWDDIQLVKNVSDEKGNHPCPIPEKLAKRIISLVANPGDVIVDTFAGSLTVLKAAQDLGFKAIGCEKSEAYIQEGLSRITQKSLFAQVQL